MITTTLAKIRACSPCENGYRKLAKNLGGVKQYGEHAPVKFSQIIGSNRLDDALWCLQTICPEHDKKVRLFAADCAERVLHLFEREMPNDNRPRVAILSARDFANGLITADHMKVAKFAAVGAAYAAADAAKAAAYNAAQAAYAAAGDAKDAAYAAADAAQAAYAAAGDVERRIQSEMLIERFS